MSRVYATWITDRAKEHLHQLLEAADAKNVSRYREWMHALGGDLGEALRPRLPTGDVLVVTTVEDADFLGRGVLEALNNEPRVKLFCYWNERDAQRDVAPIVSRYEEPIDEGIVCSVVVIKSIISGACVVRTNLIAALDKLHHDVPVFVLAPVMYKDARQKLQREFSRATVARFEYIACATDDVLEGEYVRPGIGGSVYELLGLGDQSAKNRVRPKIVSDRSQRLGA